MINTFPPLFSGPTSSSLSRQSLRYCNQVSRYGYVTASSARGPFRWSLTKEGCDFCSWVGVNSNRLRSGQRRQGSIVDELDNIASRYSADCSAHRGAVIDWAALGTPGNHG